MIHRPKHSKAETKRFSVKYSEIAQRIRDQLPMERVAEYYGFHPNRNGYIHCPFHQGDQDPSLKIYRGGKKGWHCFGCNEGGSVIDFVMRLFNISFQQACIRLNTDFGLNLLAEERKTSRAELQALAEARQREEERKAAANLEYQEKAAEYRYWVEVREYFAPTDLDADVGYIHPLFAEAIKRIPLLEYWLDQNLGR